MTFDTIALIVLDSVGIGELPDADKYGDAGAHTLGHIAEAAAGFALPNLERLGLGRIAPLKGVSGDVEAKAYYGKMAEASAGKDTMTGHWELMGLRIETPFVTFPDGFPDGLLDAFRKETGRGVLGNKVASGTDIIAELGDEHRRTGDWIVYTSADSVFQLAAHEQVVPLDELYRACEIARRLTLEDEAYRVGRVIARPFVGESGAYVRTANRHDYAVKPPAATVMNRLQEQGLTCTAVGKIHDIFTGEGVTESFPTKSNDEGVDAVVSLLGRKDGRGLLFANLVDFDSLYGHRRDPHGYAAALQAFDRRLPEVMGAMGGRDLLMITADHGNDPTHPGTDHTREYVPLLVWSPALTAAASLGVRSTFADVAATIADNFKVKAPDYGESFLGLLK